jgi:hypothetical protein
VLNDPVDLIDPNGLTAECPDCVQQCLQNNYGDLADYALKASAFGITSSAGAAIVAASVGAKAVIGGGIGGGAEAASQAYGAQAAKILSTPASTFSKTFGLQVRAAAAASASSISSALSTVSTVALTGTKYLGVAGTLVTVGATSFYATAWGDCKLQCSVK